MGENSKIILGSSAGIVLALFAFLMIVPLSQSAVINSPTAGTGQSKDGQALDFRAPDSSESRSQNLYSMNPVDFPRLLLPIVIAISISTLVFLGLKRKNSTV